MIVRGEIEYVVHIKTTNMHSWEERAKFCFFTEDNELDDNKIVKVLESYIKRNASVKSIEVLQLEYEIVNTYMLDWVQS